MTCFLFNHIHEISADLHNDVIDYWDNVSFEADDSI